jgi:DNA repair ATPase RecN
MPERAKVTSADALDGFRSAIINYVSKARPTIEEVSADAMRTRLWLENEQRTHWEAEFRRRAKELEMAQSALFSARVGSLSQETGAELMAVQRAKRALDEADTKLRVLKKWTREYEGRVQPLVKQTEKLHTILTNDMVKAVAYLTQTLNTLAAYADIKPPPEATAAPPPAVPVTAADTQAAEKGAAK